MKILILVSLMFFSFCVFADEPFQIPSFSKSPGTIESFIPKTWFILAQAKCDLNKDGKDDMVLALKSDLEVQANSDTPRLLLLLFQTADGLFQFSAVGDKPIGCRTCGGVMGDPFQDLKCERGTVVITNYGGSAEKWGQIFRLRYQNNNWYLIGKTLTTDTLMSDSSLKDTQKDFNYSTGTKIIVKNFKNGKTSQVKEKIDGKNLQTLDKLEIE